MLGGGFLGQMHQTNKQNREMLKKERRRPFDAMEASSGRDEREFLRDDKKLTDQERANLINRIKLDAAKTLKERFLFSSFP
jgi:hypothetical protein